METFNTVILILNAVLMVYCWRAATVAFEDGKNTVGWIDIFFSALNAAVIAAALL